MIHLTSWMRCLLYSELLVYSEADANEQVYPHFHVHHTGTNYVTDMCIRLDVPEYANHGSHRGELNSRGKNDLIRLLKEPVIYDDEEMSSWRALVSDWNKQYSNTVIEEMPDYRKLPSQSGSKKVRRKERTPRGNR